VSTKKLALICLGRSGGHAAGNEPGAIVRSQVLTVPNQPDLRVRLVQAIAGAPCLNPADLERATVKNSLTGEVVKDIPKLHIGAIVLSTVTGGVETARILGIPGDLDHAGELVERDMDLTRLSVADVNRITGAWKQVLTDHHLGRPEGSGLWPNRETFISAMKSAIAELRAKKKPVTQVGLAKFLTEEGTVCDDRRIREWCEQFRVSWRELCR